MIKFVVDCWYIYIWGLSGDLGYKLGLMDGQFVVVVIITLKSPFACERTKSNHKV